VLLLIYTQQPKKKKGLTGIPCGIPLNPCF